MERPGINRSIMMIFQSLSPPNLVNSVKTPKFTSPESDMRLLLLLAGLLLSLTDAGCGLADSAFYQPDRNLYRNPQQDGLAFQPVRFASTDGTPLTGWFIPATTNPALGTVVHFHGNAQNMTAHYGFVSWLPQNGFNLFVFDYRGYGVSAGSPSRTGVYEDAVAAVRYIKTRPDIDQGKIILFGQSLGGALVLRIAGNNHFAGIVGVVEESGFASYQEVAQAHFSFLGDLFVPGGDDNPIDAVAHVSPVPLLIIHGDADPVVPYAQAQQLFAAAREPKELWTIPHGQHTPALGPFRSEYAPRLLRKFHDWVGSPIAPPPP